MKCSALNIDFNGARFDPLGSRSPPYKIQIHQIWVPRSKRAVSATVVPYSKRRVADRHKLAAHRNKHC